MLTCLSNQRLLCVVCSFFFLSQTIAAQQTIAPQITAVKKINSTSVELQLSTDKHILIDFYGPNIFRMFQDSLGKKMRAPYAKPEAQILVNTPRKPVKNLRINKTDSSVSIATSAIQIRFDKQTNQFEITNLQTNKIVVKSVAPIQFTAAETFLKLQTNPSEYFYGGGVQNGRFSHKGTAIAIVNQNSWTDGGVASPAPYYWSTNGYGFMWFTFKKGNYDFGTQKKGEVVLSHKANYFDAFFMVSKTPKALLNDYYQLTGNPVLLPKFAFYEGHLNAYNRDYWKQDSTGILFEDGKKYSESQKDNGGIKESLNGEKNNYQFSARAVIDRYHAYDMPLGWILPNDGYGAGYGQASSLDSNIVNLKKFGEYARKHGVQLGLWTQSDLHPVPGVEALLQRDIVKEVGVAGVRVLKTDVAWVGAGYSFGLNGITEVAGIMTKEGNGARPFIITLDGWAGTQRYAAVWSGDQTGGEWEYIRFHIPTYIGAGLSGMSNITSDVDGIFGGKKPIINTRDFQWKTFTPMQLNMDGWGRNPKYPHALGEPSTSINRTYLKLKSELIPYTYSIAHTAVNGLPMIRAMFLMYPNDFTHGTATKYQFMYGPSFLVAPIYQNTQMDEAGNDIRNTIYLPKGKWIDYFSGEQYAGNRILNHFNAPVWKLPVFVKPGAIIPMANPNNNPTEIDKQLRIFELYPHGTSSFTLYNDDGKTVDYRKGKAATTKITSSIDGDKASVFISPTQGGFDGFVKNKATLLRFNVSEKPKKVKAYVGGKRVNLREALSLVAFLSQENVYYYNPSPNLNKFATKGSAFAKVKITKNPQFLVKIASTDITKNEVKVKVYEYTFNIANTFKQKKGALQVPLEAKVTPENTEAFALTPQWVAVDHADFYEIEFNNMLYTHIVANKFTFDGLKPATKYSFKLRAVNKTGASDWTSISAQTQADPLRFAVQNISGYSTAKAQGGFQTNNLYDFDPISLWHTKYQEKAVPFEIILDLRSVNTLDKIQYLPRKNGYNGVITEGNISYSTNKKTWTKAGKFKWKRDNSVKTFVFEPQPRVRYVKFSVTKAVGDYGSGRELYIFKVPGTSSYIPGDINSDGKIDSNDLTSYTNYTGLRYGDGDFEGYISKGDINKNNLIDAYDISNVATQLNGGTRVNPNEKLSGKLELTTDKKVYKKGEIIEITVKGENLNAVNALSFALPYDTSKYEFIGVETKGTEEMKNMTNDRLHTNGKKVLYPTFINIGNKKVLGGDPELFILKFKAKTQLNFSLKAKDGMLISKALEVVTF